MWLGCGVDTTSLNFPLMENVRADVIGLQSRVGDVLREVRTKRLQ